MTYTQNYTPTQRERFHTTILRQWRAAMSDHVGCVCKRPNSASKCSKAGLSRKLLSTKEVAIWVPKYCTSITTHAGQRVLQDDPSQSTTNYLDYLIQRACAVHLVYGYNAGPSFYMTTIGCHLLVSLSHLWPTYPTAHTCAGRVTELKKKQLSRREKIYRSAYKILHPKYIHTHTHTKCKRQPVFHTLKKRTISTISARRSCHRGSPWPLMATTLHRMRAKTAHSILRISTSRVTLRYSMWHA